MTLLWCENGACQQKSVTFLFIAYLSEMMLNYVYFISQYWTENCSIFLLLREALQLVHSRKEKAIYAAPTHCTEETRMMTCP